MHHDAILVTGGAGFIGSHFIRGWLAAETGVVVNLDNLTYAADAAGLDELTADARHVFVRGDIGDEALVSRLLKKHLPAAVVNFAAETHVDRSIREAAGFIQTNVVGTLGLLEAVRKHWHVLDPRSREHFRLLHVSTDEVYGSLHPGAAAVHERSAYAPNNPYSASKAASDHLVRAWHHTHGLPTITLNCSNHFGPRQNPEKLIPLLITRGMMRQRLPIYGDGTHERDWLYVADGCAAMRLALAKGTTGESYTVGTGTGTSNLEIAQRICRLLDALAPIGGGMRHESLIEFVDDRPGHDRRYAVDSAKLRTLTGWEPAESLDSGLRKTVEWYLRNPVGAATADRSKRPSR